jgi:hypothetical protein
MIAIPLSALSIGLISSKMKGERSVAYRRRQGSATRWIRALMRDSELSDQGNRLLDVDVRSFLVDNLLEYTDRTSMAASLEVGSHY